MTGIETIGLLVGALLWLMLLSSMGESRRRRRLRIESEAAAAARPLEADFHKLAHYERLVYGQTISAGLECLGYIELTIANPPAGPVEGPAFEEWLRRKVEPTIPRDTTHDRLYDEIATSIRHEHAEIATCTGCGDTLRLPRGKPQPSLPAWQRQHAPCVAPGNETVRQRRLMQCECNGCRLGL